jgi:anti-sigma factor RsiW
MTSAMTNDDLDDELAMLLPFYANGSLAAADVARVDAGLIQSAALRAELTEINALQSMVREGGERLSNGIDLSPRLDALMARIDAEAPPVTAPQIISRPARQTKPAFLASLFSPRWQPTLAMAAVAVVILQSGTIGYMATRDGASDYGTLSGPGAMSAKAQIIIQIAPDARWTDLEALLAREGLNIVSGPTDGSLSLSTDSPADRTRIDALVNRLQASPVVSFAGPAG